MRISKLLLISSFYAFVYFLIPFYSCQATHVIGAEISYKWVSGNTFRLELSVYRDCGSSISLPSTQKIFFSSFSCRPTQDSVLMAVSGPPVDVSPLCKQEPSNCKGGTSPGVQRYRYSGNVTLPSQCADWVFYYRECNRSLTIGTLINPQNSCLYVEARLNNLLAPQNSSPKIGNDPIAYLCLGQQVDLNPGVTDDNGDVLKFQLVTPRTNSIIPNITDVNVVHFKPGYSASVPMPAQNGFMFDSTTGQISFIPSEQIIGVAAMKISEYRNGKLIGSIMQDIQLLARDCQNASPTISGFGNGAAYEQLLCIGDSLMTEFTALDGNGNDSLKIRWNNGLPDATFSADSGIAITKAHLNWKPTIADTGIHNFTLTTFDDHCPSIGSTTKSYKLVVKIKPTISTTSDTLIPCGAIVPISSTVLTGNAPFVYSWPGRSETTPLINVGHGIYTARVQDATGCFAEDTIKLIGSSISGGIQTDTSCLVEGVQLTAVTYSADTNLTYTYQWTFPPETQLYTTKTIRRTFATSGVKNVVLKLMASDNCSVTIPTTIKVCDPPPVIVQYAPNVCQGQQFKIGCGIPGIGGLCGAHTIGIILTERNWIGYTSTGLYILPPDSLRPDSNTFKVITESVSKCSNQKIFKFRVKASPKVKIYPDRSSIVFNCNRPDTTVLIKIYKDYRYVADSLWGKIQYLDTTINLAKTVHDTIYYTLKLSKPCIVSISGIMANNCQAFSSIYYQPGAFATATTSSHCTATDSVSIGSNLQSNRFTSYVFNLGNGNQTTDSIPKIFYPPNQVFHGYFAIQDTLGCRDTADFVVDTRLPDTTVFASADSACLEGFIKLRVMDTTIIYKWSFENSSSGLVLPRGRLEDSLQFVNPGFDTIKATIAFKEGCVSSWNLPVTYVRQPIWPTSSISNICAVDSSRFNGGVSFSEFPIRSWRWKYQYPSNVSLPFSEDTVQNPVRLFNYNGSLLSILTVVNIKGCMARDTLDSNMVLISEPEFDVNGNCQNDSLIFFFGRVPDRYENIDRFTYIYNDGSVESTSNGQGLHQFSEPGVYKIKLIAFSADGCTNRDSTTLTIKPRPKADFAFPVGELCEDQTVFLSGRNSQPAAPGEKITSFVWATGDTNPVSEDTSATITIPGSGNTFIALQVKSTNGCQDYLKFPFISRPRPVPDFIANEEDLLKGDIISFQDLSTGGTVWRWDYGDGNIETITDPAKSSPSHKYTFGSAFSVEQWVASSYGCADSLSKPVNLKSYIALPKAFTPNGDQLNDGCGLLYRYIKNLEEFRIYNRLGQVVFDGGHDLDARWNGKLEGVNQPNGSYLFTAKATSVFGENLELKGNITLIR